MVVDLSVNAYFDNRSIYYLDEGDGPALIFVPGTLSDHSLWSQVTSELNRYRRLSLEVRDSGKSDMADKPYTAQDLSEDVIAVMDVAKIDKAIIIGHSLGGVVAQELAASAPQRCSGLVLCSTWAKTGILHKSVFELWLAARSNLSYEHFLQLMFLCGAGRTLRKEIPLSGFAADFAETTPTQTPEAFGRQVAANLAVDTLSRIGKISCPTLIVAGTEDFLFDHTDQKVLAANIPDSKLEFIPGAGHCPPIEQPKAFLAAIGPFLESCTD